MLNAATAAAWTLDHHSETESNSQTRMPKFSCKPIMMEVACDTMQRAKRVEVTRRCTVFRVLARCWGDTRVRTPLAA